MGNIYVCIAVYALSMYIYIINSHYIDITLLLIINHYIVML